MILALLSPLIGLLGSLLPGILRFFERKQEFAHEIRLTELKIEATVKNAEIQLDIEDIKASVQEGESLRSHDSSLDGGKFINTLRASIRPVVTYLFFFLFVFIKITAAVVMYNSGASTIIILKAIWDPETMALFSTIIAFWFGSRFIEKQAARQYGPVTRSFSIQRKPEK